MIDQLKCVWAKFRFLRYALVIVLMLPISVQSYELCGLIEPTTAELEQIALMTYSTLGGEATAVIGCMAADVTVPKLDADIRFFAYSQGRKLVGATGEIRRRTACVLGENASCGPVEDIIQVPGRQDILLVDTIPTADLMLLIGYLSGVLENGDSLVSIAYANSGSARWKLKKHGYYVITRRSPTTGVDYVFSYGCSFLGKCRWRMRNRSEWFMPG